MLRATEAREVVAEQDENTWKSARNVAGLSMARAADVNAYDLLKHHTVIFTQQSLQLVRERVGDARTEASHA